MPGRPHAWTHLLQDYQKNPDSGDFDPTIDPQGLDERWHFCPEPPVPHRRRPVRPGAVPGQPYPGGGLECPHTDFIFSAIGEELGLLGCAFTLLLLGAVVFRVIYVGLKTPDYLSRLVCLGTGAALIFQVCVNVGMCLGVAPVIGLTLPSSATAAAPSSPCIWPWVWSPASTPTPRPGQKPLRPASLTVRCLSSRRGKAVLTDQVGTYIIKVKSFISKMR